MFKHTSHLVNPHVILKLVSRSTVIMGRKYPLTEPNYKWHEGIHPDLPNKNNVWQVEENTLLKPDHNIISVLLTKDVPGLGEIGEIRNVHRQRFWRYLNPLELAELPTPERQEYFSKLRPSEAKILTGDDFVFFKRLQQGYLYIPMNRDKTVDINRSHVKVALRRMGVNIKEECIKMPSNINSNETEPFKIKIDVCGIEIVEIPAQVFHWTKLDSLNVTMPPMNSFKEVDVEDWLKPPNF